MITLASSERPSCKWKGCELLSQFHGFGTDLCWMHYSNYMHLILHPESNLSESQINLDCQAQLQLF